MFAFGTKRTSRSRLVMSAFGGNADIASNIADIAEPEPDLGSGWGHSVRPKRRVPIHHQPTRRSSSQANGRLPVSETFLRVKNSHAIDFLGIWPPIPHSFARLGRNLNTTNIINLVTTSRTLGWVLADDFRPPAGSGSVDSGASELWV